jgi:hypothetical protein
VPPVPQGFPFRLTDAELEQALGEMGNVGARPGYDDFDRLLPELKSALLVAGLTERQRRDLAASANQTITVARLTLAIAIVTLLASIILAVFHG